VKPSIEEDNGYEKWYARNKKMFVVSMKPNKSVCAKSKDIHYKIK